MIKILNSKAFSGKCKSGNGHSLASGLTTQDTNWFNSYNNNLADGTWAAPMKSYKMSPLPPATEYTYNPNTMTFDQKPFGTNLNTNQNKGLLDQIMNALGIENAESFANGAKGLASLASIGQGIYNGIMQNRAFKLQKSAMEQAMRFNAENQARQRHEWARQDANRASISASWNGR